jgi:hypothetical protein
MGIQKRFRSDRGYMVEALSLIGFCGSGVREKSAESIP